MPFKETDRGLIFEPTQDELRAALSWVHGAIDGYCSTNGIPCDHYNFEAASDCLNISATRSHCSCCGPETTTDYFYLSSLMP